MATDLDLAQVCWNLYFDISKLDRIVDVEGVTVGISHKDNHSIICFRGSTSLLDWLRDFQAQMVFDMDIGGVELGFMQGMRAIMGQRPGGAAPDKPVYITGHSLGAARALIFAAMETFKGLPIAGVTVFGPPRPGSARLKDILVPVPVRLYRNRRDPICEVPLDIPLIDPYTHVRELTAVDVAPPPNDPWGVVADHHMELYLKAMQIAAENALGAGSAVA